MEKIKPKIKLTGRDSNTMVLLGICTKALKDIGQITEAAELTKQVFDSNSYDEALHIMMEYCDVN